MQSPFGYMAATMDERARSSMIIIVSAFADVTNLKTVHLHQSLAHLQLEYRLGMFTTYISLQSRLVCETAQAILCSDVIA